MTISPPGASAGKPVFPAGTQQGWLPDAGLTLRDWFAGQALIGLAGRSRFSCAYDAYRLADAMLAAREEGGAA